MNSRSLAAPALGQELLVGLPWHQIFATRHELLATFLDGARRSGATAINIEYQDSSGILRLSDDGDLPGGPRCLGALRDGMLSAPEKLIESRPDLLRYAAAIVCANELTVHTPAYAFSLHSGRFLQGKGVFPITVRAADYSVKLALTLHPRFRCNKLILYRELTNLVRGFPLPVLLEGQPLPRPFACREHTLTRFAHGLYSMNTEFEADEFHIFLDGLPIESGDGESACLPGGTLVHLHPEIFQATVPGHREIAGGAITMAFLRYELQLITGY